MTSRLESSKNRVSLIMHQKDEFDSAQTKLMSELGLFTASVLDGAHPVQKNNLLAAIITAQLQTNGLFGEMPANDSNTLSKYSGELEKLREKIVDVNGPNDLGPLFVEAQMLLKIRDEVASMVRKDLDVSIF